MKQQVTVLTTQIQSQQAQSYTQQLFGPDQQVTMLGIER
jgi:hypothetical protein